MISALILAAGQSRRMGQPKMLLPWGSVTVIERVITTFISAGIEDVIVITGGAREQVEGAISPYPVRKTHNEEYAAGEMLSSIQSGLSATSSQAQAALIGLGDQPQIQEKTVRLICEAYRASKSGLIVPSYQMKRGHPWLVARPFWEEFLRLKSPDTPRDFLNRHTNEILYVSVDTDSILADLDTPEDYRKSHPKEN